MLLRIYEHLAWADAQTRESVAAMPEGAARDEATRLYAHLALVERLWLDRIERRDASVPAWSTLSLAEAAELAASSAAALRAIAARDPLQLGRPVAYRNSAGHEYRNTVADILSHVPLHSSYHRGQIALLVRRGGGTPALTDYIVLRRAGQRAEAQR